MPRGGRRSGSAGKAYANRTDLNRPAMGVSTPTYGDKAQQQRALQAIPLPQNTGPATAVPSRTPVPGERGAFDRDTERPGEPITSGLPIGPGPGPNAMQPAFDPVIEALRAAYRAPYGANERVAELIERLESQ